MATWRGSAEFGLSSPKANIELKSNKPAATAILIFFMRRPECTLTQRWQSPGIKPKSDLFQTSESLFTMLHFQTFIGGIFDTNGYLVQTPEGNMLIDAPTGSSDCIRDLGVRLDLMIITHGRPDHFDDAAEIKKATKCQVGYHKDGIPLMT